jgi:hypothetical protein
MSHRRRDRRRDRTRSRRNRRTMNGGVVLSPSPINESLADGWSSKTSLNQGGDFFKYHREQHGGANVVMGAPLSAVVDSTLPKDMYGPAHLSGINRANNEIIGLSDREGTPAIVPSESAAPAAPANTTGGRRRRTSRGKRRGRGRDRRSRNRSHSRNRSRRNRTRRAMSGGMDPLGYASLKAPTMLLPNREAYAAAALNPEYVSMKGYAEGIAASARDQITYA